MGLVAPSLFFAFFGPLNLRFGGFLIKNLPKITPILNLS